MNINIKNYYDFLKMVKNTNIKERLRMKDYEDKRLNSEYIYTEIHHILPKSLGGGNNSENLVELLPEEHLLIHWLRYKAFKNREDFLAVRLMLNAKILSEKFESFYKKKLKDLPDEIVDGVFLKIYSEYKNEISEFRKTTGWHSEDGRKRISEARKGKFPCIDAKTGEKVGSVDKNHPKVLSGEWVHQTKGWTTAIDVETGEKVRIKSGNMDGIKYICINSSKGEKNSRFNKDFYNNFQDFIKDAEKFFKEIGVIISAKVLMKLKKLGYNHPFIQNFIESDFRLKQFNIKSYNEEFLKIEGIPVAISKKGLPKELKIKTNSTSTLEHVEKILQELKYVKN